MILQLNFIYLLITCDISGQILFVETGSCQMRSYVFELDGVHHPRLDACVITEQVVSGAVGNGPYNIESQLCNFSYFFSAKLPGNITYLEDDLSHNHGP